MRELKKSALIVGQVLGLIMGASVATSSSDVMKRFPVQMVH